MAPDERDEQDERRGGSHREAPACPLAVLRPPTGPLSVVLPLVGVVDDELTAGLCGVVRTLLESDAVDVVTCDATGAEVDIGLVGALARMHVTAQRFGCAIRIRAAGTDLRLLVELVGLADVLSVEPGVPPSDGERW